MAPSPSSRSPDATASPLTHQQSCSTSPSPRPQGPGFITVYPCTPDVPTAANLNYGTGTTIPNSVIAQVGASGEVCIYTSNTTHIVVDVNGYFQ